MKQKRQYRLMEIAFLLIGIGALGLGVVQTFGLVGPSQTAPEALVVVEEAHEPLLTESTDSEVTLFENAAEPADSEMPSLDDDAIVAEPDDEADFAEDEAEEGIEEEETADFGEEAEGQEVDVFVTVAQLMGIDVETLEAELLAGKSIAEVAASRNVAVQPIIDAFIAEELALLEDEVAAGLLEADAANEWREEITRFAPFIVNTAYLEPEVVAAQTIGIEMEAFWDAIESGQTIQAIAEANNVAAQAVVDAIVASEKAYADKMVAAGLMEREELAEWDREVYQMADAMVNGR